MSAPQLAETARNMIIAEIKAKIADALTQVRGERDDAVSTEPPKSYFIFDGAHTYQCPAIFTVVDRIDFPEETTGPNHVNARIKMFVSVVIEDREADKLTIKAERYQAALFKVLHWLTLSDDVLNVKIWSWIRSAQFSPLYTKARSEDMGVFRKEVSLELEVQNFENPN